jgi:hypothetical protein
MRSFSIFSTIGSDRNATPIPSVRRFKCLQNAIFFIPLRWPQLRQRAQSQSQRWRRRAPSAPASSKRYYSVQLCDSNTYDYGHIGSRATGSEAGDYMVVCVLGKPVGVRLCENGQGE